MEQAEKSPVNFLFNGLKLMAEAESRYRASKDQRLTVELMLYELGVLTIEKSSTEADELETDKASEKTVRKKIYKAPKTVSVKQELSNAQSNKVKYETKPIESIPQPEQEQETPKSEEKVEEVVELTNQVTATLESVWEKIKLSVEELGPRINQAVQAADPKLIDDNTIKIHITAESHKDLYEKHKKSIYEVLSMELGIKDLVFTYELVKSELDDKRPLKDVEKYQKMVEENPALQLLKDKFNLDLKK